MDSDTLGQNRIGQLLALRGAFDSGAQKKKPHSLSGRDRLTRRYSKQAANHCTRSTLERVFTSNQVPAGPLLPVTTADKEWRC
jgi:hypothetical protein